MDAKTVHRWDYAGFNQVNDGEEHQRLVRGNAANLRTSRVEVGEFTEPVVGSGHGSRSISDWREKGTPFLFEAAVGFIRDGALDETGFEHLSKAQIQLT